MEQITIKPIKRPTLRESIKIDLDTNLKGALAFSVDKFAVTIPKLTRFFDVKMQPINENTHKLTLSTSDVNIDYIVTVEKQPNSNYLKVMEIR